METMELSDGTIVTCMSIDLSTFNRLREESIYSEPISVIKKVFNVEAYQLRDKVLANDRGYCMIFNSLEDLEKVLNDFNPVGTEIMSGKNPYGKRFPNYTHALVENLLKELAIEPTETFDENLLYKVDSKLNEIKSTEFKKKHFICLVALLGEVLKSKGEVDWEMKLSSDGQTWNPYLRKGNHTFESFTYLYEDIYVNRTSLNLLVENFDLLNKDL